MRRPALLVAYRHLRGRQVQSEHIQPAPRQSLEHAPQVSLGLRLRGQVAEAVDRVEGRVDWPFQAEVGHVAHDRGRAHPVADESLVAVLHRLGVQIVARHRVARLGELEQQPPCPAGRLEQPPHPPTRVLLETCAENGTPHASPSRTARHSTSGNRRCGPQELPWCARRFLPFFPSRHTVMGMEKLSPAGPST